MISRSGETVTRMTHNHISARSTRASATNICNINFMDEKFRKHYQVVVKTVTELGEQVKKLNEIVLDMQIDVIKLKEEMITANMTLEDKEQFLSVFGEKENQPKEETIPKI